MSIYAPHKLAHILAREDALAAVAFARDMVGDEGKTEQAWRLLDNRRQRLVATLSPEEDCQLEECRAEHLRREAEKEQKGHAGVSRN